MATNVKKKKKRRVLALLDGASRALDLGAVQTRDPRIYSRAVRVGAGAALASDFRVLSKDGKRATAKVLRRLEVA